MIDNLIGRVTLSGENEITDGKGEKLYSLLDCDGGVLDAGRYPILYSKLVGNNLPNIPDPVNGGITGKYKIIADK